PALSGPTSSSAVGDTAAAAAYTDIKQGANDNCYFLAALSSLALTDAHLDGRIHSLGGNNYTVDLYARDNSGLPSVKSEPVSFDGTWTPKEPLEPQAGEFWTILYARAFQNLLKDEGITKPTNRDAWLALTGRNPENHPKTATTPFTRGDPLRMQRVLAAGGNA